MEFVAGKRKSVSEEVLDFIRQGGLEKERSRRNFGVYLLPVRILVCGRALNLSCRR